MIGYKDIKNNADINTYIREADKALISIGYTEHHFAHATKVAERAGDILARLGYSEREAELARIAGYMHDIGNLVNRIAHSQSGALMAFRILDKLGMSAEEIALITAAIGNHDEGTGTPVNPIAAALIIADKTDVRRTRVRSTADARSIENDIHDRVNYSVKSSSLDFSDGNSTITLTLEIDTDIGSVADYFEIFLTRMTMCRLSAKSLGVTFGLRINGQELI
jgi:metal-dependent HD superfamily phosphatase/phosphodiesterase